MYKCSLATNTPTDHVLLCLIPKMYNHGMNFSFVHMIVHNQRDNNYDKPFGRRGSEKKNLCNYYPDAGKTTITEKCYAVRTGDSDRRYGKGRGQPTCKNLTDGDGKQRYLYHHPVMQCSRITTVWRTCWTPLGHEDFSEDTCTRTLTARWTAV